MARVGVVEAQEAVGLRVGYAHRGADVDRAAGVHTPPFHAVRRPEAESDPSAGTGVGVLDLDDGVVADHAIVLANEAADGDVDEGGGLSMHVGH